MNVKHAMPVVDFQWPVLTEVNAVKDYHHSESNIRPVEASTIELGYKIETLEEEVRFEKTNVLYAQQANEKLDIKICELELKCANLEFKISNQQRELEKIPTLKRTIKYMMAEHLDIELGDE